VALATTNVALSNELWPLLEKRFYIQSVRFATQRIFKRAFFL
jgi:hypothetical protein